jgi:hypothetical protein
MPDETKVEGPVELLEGVLRETPGWGDPATV